MAKPRVFISSTFYDLKQTRSELDRFIESLGYEPIRNEEGEIPYGTKESLQQYCYKEIESVDVLISIIGGKYGSAAIDKNEEKMPYSVSQMELKTAIENEKQVFIFIDANVLSEYETYLLNRNNVDVKYKYAEDSRIYKFIEEIKSLSRNNNIKGFSSIADITRYLKEQFAGLMKMSLSESSLKSHFLALRDIKETAKTLRELVDYFNEESKETKSDAIRILRVDHPLVKELKKVLNVKYNFYIEGKEDLDALLAANGFIYQPFEGIWHRSSPEEHITVKISDSLFTNGVLNYIKHSDWNSEYVKIERVPLQSTPDFDGNDLPF